MPYDFTNGSLALQPQPTVDTLPSLTPDLLQNAPPPVDFLTGTYTPKQGLLAALSILQPNLDSQAKTKSEKSFLIGAAKSQQMKAEAKAQAALAALNKPLFGF